MRKRYHARVPLTAAEIRHEVLVVPRRAWLEVPDLRVIERPGWMQIVTPSFTRGGNNEVAHAELSERGAAARVDERFAIFALGAEQAIADAAPRAVQQFTVALREDRGWQHANFGAIHAGKCGQPFEHLAGELSIDLVDRLGCGAPERGQRLLAGLIQFAAVTARVGEHLHERQHAADQQSAQQHDARQTATETITARRAFEFHAGNLQDGRSRV